MIDLHEFFDRHEDEFLKFERVQNKLSKRPDIHAFMLLDSLVPGKKDLVSAAEHDEIFLDVDVKKLVKAATSEQLIDLHRCGVRYDEDGSGLCMFV